MKTTITKMKNTLGDINIRLDEAEGQISNLEDKQQKQPIRIAKKKKETKSKKNEDSLRRLWDIKCTKYPHHRTRWRREKARD